MFFIFIGYSFVAPNLMKQLNGEIRKIIQRPTISNIFHNQHKVNNFLINIDNFLF